MCSVAGVRRVCRSRADIEGARDKQNTFIILCRPSSPLLSPWIECTQVHLRCRPRFILFLVITPSLYFLFPNYTILTIRRQPSSIRPTHSDGKSSIRDLRICAEVSTRLHQARSLAQAIRGFASERSSSRDVPDRLGTIESHSRRPRKVLARSQRPQCKPSRGLHLFHRLRSRASLSRRLQDPNHRRTYKARTLMAEFWTRSSTHTGGLRLDPRDHRPNSAAPLRVDPEIQDLSGSLLDLHHRLNPSQRSLLYLLQRHRQSLHGSRQNQHLFKRRRAFSRAKSRKLEKVLLSPLQALSLSPKRHQPASRPGSNQPKQPLIDSPKWRKPFRHATQALRKNLPHLKMILHPCLCQSHHRKLPSEPILSNAPIPSQG